MGGVADGAVLVVWEVRRVVKRVDIMMATVALRKTEPSVVIWWRCHSCTDKCC